MNAIKDGGPAFPSQEINDRRLAGNDSGAKRGMTLRQYAAIKAMEGLLANPTESDLDVVDVATFAVAAADAMLKELAK